MFTVMFSMDFLNLFLFYNVHVFMYLLLKGLKYFNQTAIMINKVCYKIQYSQSRHILLTIIH